MKKKKKKKRQNISFTYFHRMDARNSYFEILHLEKYQKAKYESWISAILFQSSVTFQYKFETCRSLNSENWQPKQAKIGENKKT